MALPPRPDAASLPTEQRRALAVELLCELADLSADAEALALLRRESESFEPGNALVDLYLDLLACGEDGAAFDELGAFAAELGRESRAAEALRLLEGLTRLEAEQDPASEKAARLRRAAAAAFAALQGVSP